MNNCASKFRSGSNGPDGSVIISGAGNSRTVKLNARFRVRIITAAAAVILSAIVSLTACSKKDGEKNTGDGYYASLKYSDGAEVPQCDENSPAYELLRHVLTSEVIYYGKNADNEDEVLGSIESLKNKLALAVNAGYDMTEEEREAFRNETTRGLYYTYQTDQEKRAEYDTAYDTYSDENFALRTYGITLNDYLLIRYEESVAGKYTLELREKIASKLTPDQIYKYYTEHENEFEFAETDVIMTSRSSTDVEGDLNKANELAQNVFGEEGPDQAAEQIRAMFPQLLDWNVDNGSVILMSGITYTGLCGEIQRRFTSGEKDKDAAYALEFEGNIYVIITRRGGVHTLSELESSGMAEMIKELIAGEEADNDSSSYGVTVVR